MSREAHMARQETQRIANQLTRAVNGPAWHGPAILELLDGVTAKTAAARPIAGAHSIWELVAHTTAWLEIARLRLEGRAPQRVTKAMDWPPRHSPKGEGGTPAKAWKSDLIRLRRAATDLEQTIAALDDGRLTEKLPGAEAGWSTYVTVHGVVQHLLYHAGQIAILKKGTS
jgi:hypothetical protein